MIGRRVLTLASLTLCAFLSGSCSKVVFEADPNAQQNGAGGPNGGGGPLSDINCSVYFNNHLSSVTVAAAAANPDVHADCTPANVNLNWTVRNAGGTPVTVNGLTGANSAAADFYSLGTGNYSVVLHATAPNYNDFTSNPITATVQGPVPPPVTPITCTVTVNGGTAPITLTSASANPTVNANCNPAAGSYVWTVTQGGVTVTVPGLSGFNSTPSFPTMPAGTYLIYLNVSQAGYLPFTSTTPLQVTVSAPTTHPVTTTKLVTAQNNQLDILLVVDDSKSMEKDNARLAARLQPFVDNLTTSGFDWQMCATVTRAQQLTSSNPTLYWGASNFWSGNPTTPQYLLKAGTANLSTIFANTINISIGAGWLGSDDERGIKAAYWHLYNGDPSAPGNSGCYRKDAGLAMIFISDEDERSVGGDPTQQYYTGEYKPLETDDLPQTLINQVKSIFGTSKRFVANSIIVRPGDTTCTASQDAEGSKSHYGTKYAELSALTGGYAANICATDYANSLEYFKNSIVTNMSSLALDCVPVGGAPVVTVTPAFAYTYSLNGNSVVFSPAIPAGRTIQVQYNCPN